MKNIAVVLGVALLLVGQVVAQIIGDCKDVDCPEGYKCSEGVCVKQQQDKTQVRKKLCTLNYEYVPVKCTNRNYECNRVDGAASCGFTAGGEKVAFVNDCLPCLDTEVSFYYSVGCEQAPKVCSEGQECVNGDCLELFMEEKYTDYVKCNSSRECRPIVELCVAGKCVKLSEADNVLNSKNVRAPN